MNRKSIAATYLLHLVENREESKSMLRNVGKKMQEVDAGFGEFCLSRSRSTRKRGLAVALQGYHHSLPAALKSAA